MDNANNYNTKNCENELAKWEKIFELLYSYLIFNPIHWKIMGSSYGGLFLAYLLELKDVFKSLYKQDEFYVLDEDIKERTGLNNRQIQQSKKRLKELGIFEINKGRIRINDEWKNVDLYRFNQEKFNELVYLIVESEIL